VQLLVVRPFYLQWKLNLAELRLKRRVRLHRKIKYLLFPVMMHIFIQKNNSPRRFYRMEWLWGKAASLQR